MGSSALIDSLVYSYSSSNNSNRLYYVQDKVNDAASTLGDFKEITTGTTQDYTYDGNGNMTVDNNKGISSIVYNYLNLPETITVTGKGTVVYTYDAAGNKLQKTTTDNIASLKTVTTYIGAFTYQYRAPLQGTGADTLQFIGMEEGRVRPKTNARTDTMYYDYMEKDHLGNVRVMLTDELKTDIYPTLDWEGTAGTAAVTNQDAVWSNASGAAVGVITNRIARPAGYGTATTQGSYVRQIKKSTGAMGANMLLKVMSGDQLSTSIDYYYTVTSADNSTANGLTTLVNSLLAAITGSPDVSAAAKAGATTATTTCVLQW